MTVVRGETKEDALKTERGAAWEKKRRDDRCGEKDRRGQLTDA